MNTAPTKVKSKEERAAIFAKLFANIAPGEKQKPSVFQRLEEYREDIAAKRAEGYTWNQIAVALRQEPVSIRTSPPTLREFLGEKKRSAPKKPEKKPFILRPIIPLDPPPASRK